MSKTASIVIAAFYAACLNDLVAYAQTASNKSATIELRYVTVEDRLRPRPQDDIRVERRITLTLSPGGALSENYSRVSGATSRSVDRDDRLGGAQGSQDFWRVIGPTKLQRVRNFRQSVETITVVTAGDTCAMSFAHNLKSGYTEVEIRDRFGLGDLAYYRPPRAVDMSCVIH